MFRLFIVAFAGFALLATACSKNNEGDESVFYGTWVNSNGPKDTLVFMRKNNKNLLRFNQSFNVLLPAYSEVEYRVINGKLAVALFGPTEALYLIDSFTWQQVNKQFDILGFQLYLIMSSSATHFTYTKVN